jgi:hypothetical protein
MADNTVKKLQTRIKLKYDSYSNWMASTITLLKGELAICEIPAVEGQTRTNVNSDAPATPIPTVLFKVGDGSKTFSQLPWASSKAADVHAWVKAVEMKLIGTELKFVDANGLPIAGIPTINLGNTFATDVELEDVRSTLAAQISDINAALGTSGSGIGNDVAGLKAAVEIINGAAAVEGSIAKAEADAIAAAASDATTKAGTAKTEAVAAAKTYTDTEVGKDRARIGDLETLTAGHTTSISDNAANISKEETARKSAITGIENAYKAADKVITDAIGTTTDASTKNTVYGAIAAAKAEGTAAKNSIATLTGTDGAITLNTAGVAKNKTDIANLTQTVTDNKQALEAADKALEERLDKFDLFFGEADADGKPTGEGLYDALDTLKEIQDFIKDEGSAADALAETVAGHTTSIKNINDSLAEGGTIGGAIKANTANISGLSGRMDTAEQGIRTNANDILTLKGATAGFDATTTIAARFTSVEGTLSTTTETADDAKDIADANKTALENLTKDGGRISAIEVDVSNAKTDINNLKKATSGYSGEKAIFNDVKAAKDAAAAAATAASTADGKAVAAAEAASVADGKAVTADGKAVAAQNTANTANALAESNKTRIADIEADYLTKADYFIIDCGDADENTFSIA